jgi:hypothetical protein
MQNHHRNSYTIGIASISIMACAVLSTFSANAAPRIIDPVAETLSRLKTTAAGRTADGYVLSSIKLKGDISTTGLRFVLPSVVPEVPSVLMQGRVTNCNNREITGRADVSESVENSETFSKSETMGGTTTIEVGYQSPIGLSGSASQSFEISGTKTEEKTQTKTRTWNVGNDVPVGSMQSVVWQFVVATKELNNIPWSTTAMVSGPVELNYDKPAGSVKVCLHEHAGYQGKKKCFTTSQALNIAKFKDQKWDGDKKNINDEVTAVEIIGNAKVTLFEHTDYKGWNIELTSSSSNVGKDRNDRFSAMKIEPLPSSKTVNGNLDTLLTEAQRRILLSGTYKGVNGVMGDFRAAAPQTLTAADCNTTETAAASSQSNAASFGRSAPTAIAGVRASAVRVQANAGATKIVPIQGRILKAGIAPTSETTVKGK